MECLTKVGIEAGDFFAPYTTGLVLVIGGAAKNCMDISDGNRVMMGIVLEIIGLISLPFILLEMLFMALVDALVLAGEAIKYSCANDMESFNAKAAKIGEHLRGYVLTGLIHGFFAGPMMACDD